MNGRMKTPFVYIGIVSHRHLMRCETMSSDRNKTLSLVVNKFHGQEIVGSALGSLSASAHRCCFTPTAVQQLESLGFVCRLEVLFTFAVFPEQLAGRHIEVTF